MLATLPDGTSVVSVVVNDLPRPRHLYRIVSSSGTTLREHDTLHDVAGFLLEQGTVPGDNGVRSAEAS